MDADAPILPPDIDAGFRRFRSGRYAEARERYLRLGTEGQRPSVAVIACSDSRSAPEMVFDAGPGELFVIRNIGGLVPAYEPDGRSHAASAALEYAVLALGVGHIVVLGHGRCGAIAAALAAFDPLSATDFVGTWIRGLRDIAAELDPTAWPDAAGRQHELELRSVEQSLANLRTFPWIRERERSGTVDLHGAWFDIALGELDALSPEGWATIR
ncbi:MAG TPA: carbonic anhydrase [Candidatus Limnocylindrales bacterium]|nr:carbonic anhydrase [Candidatus Limnocylindrales bacterium]